MTLQRKTLRLMLGAALLVLAAGCSGINASKTISPLDFFMPGLLKVEPPPATNDLTLPEMPAVRQVALTR